MKFSKRTVLWIIPLLIIGVFYYFYGPQDDITDNTYIDYVKNQTLQEDSNQTIAQALESYCEKSEWVYFKTQKRQNVVEFKGECPQGGTSQPVNWQFIVEDEQTDYTMGVLLLDHVKQEDADKEAFIETIYRAS